MIFAPNGGGGGINRWATNFIYGIDDVVFYNKSTYLCITGHTAAAAFETDFAAGKWQLLSQMLPNYISDYDGTALGAWSTYSDNETATMTIASPAVVTVPSTTGYYVGLPFHFTTTGALPTGVTAATTYYISSVVSSTTFQFSATLGGSAVNTSGSQSGVHTFKPHVPIDGIGGSPTLTYAPSTDSSMRGATNFLLTKSATDRAGEGFSYPFTIDASDKTKVLQNYVEYLITNVTNTYADDTLQFWVYDVTNGAMIQPAPFKVKASGIIEKFPFEFQATTSTSYRLIAHISVSTSTDAWTIRFRNWSLGPQAKLYGSPVTDWVSFTPTGSWTTNTTYTGRWRRVGDSAEYDIQASVTGGAPGGTAALTFNLPHTIDTSKYTAGLSIIGFDGTASDSGGLYDIDAYVASSTSIQLAATNATTSSLTNLTSTYPFSFGVSGTDVVNAKFSLPILGWSSSTIMSSDSSQSVVAAFAKKAVSGSVASSETVLDFGTATVDKTGSISGTGTSWRYTVAVPGTYRVTAHTEATSTAANTLYIKLLKSGSVYNAAGHGVNAATYTMQPTVTGIVDCIAGDTLYASHIASNTSGTFANDANLNWINIERISGPAQIAASDTISALYTGAPPTGTLNTSFNTVTFPTKVKDSHGAYSSGSYTIPSAGQYDIGATLDVTHVSIALNQYVAVSIHIDGVEKYTRYAFCSSTSVLEYFPQIDIKAIPLLAGQVVTIRSKTTGTTPSWQANAPINNFYINRSGNY